MLQRFKTLRTKHWLIIFALVSVGVGLAFLTLAPKVQAITMTPIQDVLSPTGTDTTGIAVRGVWNSFLGFVNSVMVVILVVIAFANILHVQIDNYSIKKILPSLIIAIVLANFSYFICRFIIDIANMILHYIMFGDLNKEIKIDETTNDISTNTGQAGIGKITSGPEMTGLLATSDLKLPKPGEADFWSKLWGFHIAQLGRIVLAVFILLLSFLFFIRNWIIYFLVALSPLGFIAMAIPQGKNVFNSWWKNFIQWVFMPVVSVFWLWVGSRFLVSGIAKGNSTMIFAFVVACFYFALTTPFKMGGAIMQQWSNLGKKAWGSTAGAAGRAGVGLAKERWIKPAIGDVKERIKSWYGNKVMGNGFKTDENGETLRDSSGRAIIDRRGALSKVLGWHYDRSKTVAIDRSDRVERFKAMQDQMQGNAMNQWTTEKRHRRSKYIDETGGFLGEIERTELDQKNEFLKTEDGIKALQRTHAYRQHVQALKDDIKKSEISMGPKWVHQDESFFYEMNPDGTVKTGPDGRPIPKRSGNGLWTRRGVKNFQDSVHNVLPPAEMAADKTIKDDEISQTLAAAKLNYSIDYIKTLAKERKELRRKVDQTANEQEREEFQQKLTEAEQLTGVVRDDISELLKNTFEDYGRIPQAMRDMLGDAYEYSDEYEDENGKKHINVTAHTDELPKMQTLGELAGYEWDGKRDSANSMVTDRANKYISLAHKKELTVETDKRNGIESGTDLLKYLKALEKFYAGQFRVSEGVQMRNAESRLANLIKCCVTGNDPLQGQANEMLWTEVRNLRNFTNNEAVRNLIRENDQVFGHTITTALRDQKFAENIGRAFGNAARAQGLTDVTDEKTFFQAEQTARAAGDDTEAYTRAREAAHQDIIKQILSKAGVDSSLVRDGGVNITIEENEKDGRILGADVQTDDRDNLDTQQHADRIAQIQDIHAHIATQYTSQRALGNEWKQFAGAVMKVIDLRKKETHRRMEDQRKREMQGRGLSEPGTSWENVRPRRVDQPEGNPRPGGG